MNRKFFSLVVGIILTLFLLYNNSTFLFKTQKSELNIAQTLTSKPTFTLPVNGVSIKNLNISFSDSINKNINTKAFIYELGNNNELNTSILSSIFNLEDSNLIINNLTDTSITTSKDYNSSLMTNLNGTFLYSNRNLKLSENKLTKNDCQKVVYDFLTKNNLLPNDYILYERKEKYSDKFEFHYNRKLDMKDIYGDSGITTIINSSGNIESISYFTRPIICQNEITLKSVDKAILELKEDKCYISDTSNNIIIDTIALAYWENSTYESTNKYIYPVYYFKGKNFSAFVSAI